MDLILSSEWRGPNRASHAAGRVHPAPGVEVHHSDTGRAVNRDRLIAIARAIYDDHVHNRGWKDVFYGLLLGDDCALEARGYDRLSGDIPHLTVCVIGRYSTGQMHPTPDQVQMIAEARQLVVERGGGTDLTWHSRRAQTDCPGGNNIVILERFLDHPFPGIPLPGPHPTPAPVPAPGDDYAMPPTLDLRDAQAHPLRHPKVDTLQALLLVAGFGPAGLVGAEGRPDGIAGGYTRAAVGDFQRRTNTGNQTTGSPDYIVGARTWRALIEQ